MQKKLSFKAAPLSCHPRFTLYFFVYYDGKLTVCFEWNLALEFAAMIHSLGHFLVYNCRVPSNLRRSSPSLLSSAPVFD